MIRSRILLFGFILMSCTGVGQTIFNETFSSGYTNTSTGSSGSNNGINWTAVCPGSVASTDYFKVVSGRLEGRDTNGEATFETDEMDLFPCLSAGNGFEVSVDIVSSGDLEGCTSGCGCNCIDWVRVDYQLDGGPWTSISSVNGGTCSNGSCGTGTFAAIDASNFTLTSCFTGSTFKLRIAVSCWAGSEYWRIDNVNVSCSNCALDINAKNFDAVYDFSKDQVNLDWSVDDIADVNHFILEKSNDGKQWEYLKEIGASAALNYQNIDPFPFDGISYYKLTAVTHENKLIPFNIQSVQVNKESPLRLEKVKLTTDQLNFVLNKNIPAHCSVQLFDTQGQVVANFSNEVEARNISNYLQKSLSNGLYILAIYDNGYPLLREKVWLSK